MRWIKQKVFFMIYLIICLSFSVYLVKPVEAQQACCEVTKEGEYCRHTAESQCSEDYAISLTPCEETTFCKDVCCIDNSDGSCYPNTPNALCQFLGSTTWNSDSSCSSVQSCEKGCCVIGSQCGYMTEQRCNLETSKYDLPTVDFRAVASETNCVDICRKMKDGCCLSGGLAIYTKGEECTGTFYPEQFCSSITDACKAKDHEGCRGEDVYWFDSCGNPEGIAQDCDYDTGTMCALVDNNFVCKNMDCSDTFDNPQLLNDGAERKSGESWCSYDSGLIGSGYDLVGSRHYRHLCINGEEIIEPCRDFREEFCAYGTVVVGEQNYTEGICKENRWWDCTTTCNTAEDEDQGTWAYSEALKKDKECCEKAHERDCLWLGGEKEDIAEGQESSSSALNDICSEPVIIDGVLKYKQVPCVPDKEKYAEGGKCIPVVPPGFKLWKGEGEDECNQGDQQCTVVWKRKKKWGHCRTESTPSQNAHCIEDDWLTAVNALCRSLGDCGAHYNVAGDFTTEGIVENAPGKLRQELVGSFEEWLEAGRGLYYGIIDVEEVPSGLAGLLGIPAGKTFMVALSVVILTGVNIAIIGTAGVALGLWGAGAGVAAETGAAGLAVAGGLAAEGAGGAGAGLSVIEIIAAVAWVVAIAALLFMVFDFLFGDCSPRVRTYTVDCRPWQPPYESNCDKCIDEARMEELGYNTCTEYRCKSLGLSCEYVETTQGSDCVDIAPYDVNSAVITPDSELLSEQGFAISDYGMNGYTIKENIEAFTRVTIGVKTDELARCKYDTNFTSSYDDMSNYVSYQFSKTHNLTLFPEAGKTHDYLIRCIDIKGNYNQLEYKITFTIEDEPDLTPPFISHFSPAANSYLKFGTLTKDIEIYAEDFNPVECRFDYSDKPYNLMSYNASCAENRQGNFFKCFAQLKNLKKENRFYFRCKDIEDNIMQEPYNYLIYVSDSLNLTLKEPSGRLYYNDVTLAVETAGGSEAGKAVCKYSLKEKPYDQMVKFFNTDSTRHEQLQTNLKRGNYNYYVKCQDTARNEVSTIIKFTVDVDIKAPEVISVYKDESFLHLILSEESDCQYLDEPFAFGEGIDMTNPDSTTHSAPLTYYVYYINCQDQYDNLVGFTVYV